MLKICFVLLLLTSQGYSAIIDWKGMASDLKNPLHWSHGLPQVSDSARFEYFPGLSKTPTLKNALLAIGGMEFADTTAFSIQLQQRSDLFLLENGIWNGSMTLQKLVGSDNSGIYFRNYSSADLTGSGKVEITVVNDSFLHFDDHSTAANATLIAKDNGSIEFANQAQAGSSTIYLDKASLLFSDQSTAGAAHLLVQEGSATFEEQAEAGSSLIEVRHGEVDFYGESRAAETLIQAYNGSKILFHEKSSAGEAQIYAHNSKVLFDGESQGERAQLVLQALSSLEVQSNITLSSLVTDGSSQVKLAGQLEVGRGDKNSYVEGSITGRGGLIKVGSGALVLQGSNSYQGGTEVLEGSLEGNALSLQGRIQNEGRVVFDQSLWQHFKGEIFGKGLIDIRGSGLVNFQGENGNFAGTTSINGGSLYLSQRLGGDLLVNEGGTLLGPGSVGGSLTLNPEGRVYNGPESLAIGGNYTQNPNSYYRVHYDNPIEVDGKALLQGGVVELHSNLLPLKQAFAILHAQEGLEGSFSQVTTPNPLLKPSLSYDGHHALLTISTQFQSVAPGLNRRNVTRQLDNIPSPNHEESLLLTSLASLPLEQFPDAIEELSGLQYSNLLQISELTNRSFMRRIYDPFRPSAMDCCERGCGIFESTFESIFESWVSLEGGNGFLKRDSNALGFSMYHTALSFGAHGYLFPSLAIGVAGNYGFDHLRFNLGGSGNSNSGQGALYALYEDNWGYIFGLGMVGYNHWNITQVLDFDIFALEAKSAPEVFNVAFYGEWGWDFYFKHFMIQPFIGLQFGHYERGKVESGGGVANLVIERQEMEDCEGRMGAHASSAFYCFTLGADLAWQYRFTSLGNRIQNRFADFGELFEIRGPNQGHSTLEGALYLSMPITASSLLYSRLTGEKSNRLIQYALTFGLQTLW